MPDPRAPLLALLLLLVGAASAQVEAALGHLEAGRDAAAAEALERAVAADPGDARAHRLLARARTFEGEAAETSEEAERLFALAEAAALRAVELTPEDPEAHLELARALGRLALLRGPLSAANLATRTQEALEAAAEADPEHAGAWHALARFHHEAPWIVGGRAGLVEPYFERAIELAPDTPTHRVDWAEVLLDLGRPDAAREQLDAAEALPVDTREDREAAAKAAELRARLP